MMDVIGISHHAPAIALGSGAADVVGCVERSDIALTPQAVIGIDCPAFEGLGEALPSGDVIVDGAG